MELRYVTCIRTSVGHGRLLRERERELQLYYMILYHVVCILVISIRATSVNVQLPCLRKDLRTGSISRDIVNFPSEPCRRKSGTFTELARLVPPDDIDIIMIIIMMIVMIIIITTMCSMLLLLLLLL